MSQVSLQPELQPSTEEKQALLERILASSHFSNSQRLSAFLIYICREEMQGRAEEIHEQLIGRAVFGRPVGYDVANDSIVRSQARFLRKRLERYFSEEGRNEDVILRVPKGAYQPLFCRASEEPAAVTAPVVEEEDADAATPSLPARSAHVRSGKGALLLLLATILLLLIVAGLWWSYRQLVPRYAAAHAESAFWHQILASNRTTLLVPSDSSLVILEKMRQQPVPLSEYMNRSYQNAAPEGASEALWRSVLHSQYTSLADLNLVSLLMQRTAAYHTHTEIRYARDLSLEELKQNNAILIGGVHSNPWVDLFGPAMRLSVGYDQPAQRNFVANRAPLAGEDSIYYETGNRDPHQAYGVVAWLPSLDGQGSALLISGTSKAGTEAAGDFLFGAEFGAFLRSIEQNGTVPHFEVLLSAESVNGESHGEHILFMHRLH